MKEIDMDIAGYFPGVGSTFSSMILKKGDTNPTQLTKFRNNGKVFFSNITESTKWIPNDFCRESISIHSKVMFSDSEKFSLGYDYVTCHNVIRHSQKKHDEKIEKKMHKLFETQNNTKSEQKITEEVMHLLSKRKDVRSTLMETPTAEHTHPVFHTNNKTWYSSVKQDFSDERKVMWSRSGYTKPFYDQGQLGCTDMGYYIKVRDDTAGRNLEKFLNSILMQYIFKTAKWSGFGNEIVFSSIPNLPLDDSTTDSDYYDYFGLSKEEISYIEKYISGNGQKIEPDIKEIRVGKITPSTPDRVKLYGEVFTPIELVDKILDSIPEGKVEDNNASIIDPACGNGNFLLRVIDRRYQSSGDLESSIKNVFGVDIQEDNIEELKHRIRELYGEEYQTVANLVDRNFIVGNFLEE